MAVIQEELKPPVSAAVALPVTRTSARHLGVWLAVAGWASLAAMWITGSAGVFGHDQEGLPAILAIGAFLVGWIAPRFMVGYFFAWALFGAAAFAGDGILHLSVASLPWLAERPSLIVGGAAMFAGLAELLGRTPPPTFSTISPGGGSFYLGKAHAVDRIRRCWPLMRPSMDLAVTNPRPPLMSMSPRTFSALTSPPMPLSSM